MVAHLPYSAPMKQSNSKYNAADSTQSQDWCVYIVRCADGTYYTGVTLELEVEVW